MRAEVRNRAILFLGVFLAGVLLVAAAVFDVVNRPDPLGARPFDQASWAAANGYDRAPMAKDAIRHLPAGLPEAEVLALLGKPDYVVESWRLRGSGPSGAARTYCYDLGSWGFDQGEGTFLWVHLGADGRVVEAVIGVGYRY